MRNIILVFLVFVKLCFAGSLSFDEASTKAKSSDKDILVFFHMTSCPYCEKMLNESFKDAKTLEYIKENYILMDINIKKTDKIIFKNSSFKNKEFADKFNMFSYPSSLFLDQNLDVIYTDYGYRNLDEFLILLKFVKTRSFKSVDMDDFANNLEFENE